jgi:hypothetical protein
MSRRVFVDCEATNLPWEEGQVFWIGLADDHGATWSGVIDDVPLADVSDFVRLSVLPYLSADEPRLSRREIAEAVRSFCGPDPEFWAWCPTVELLADAFDLGGRAEEMHARWWDWDLQMVREVVDPWPRGWTTRLDDLNALATSAGIRLPPNPPDQHHPAADALWGRSVHLAASRVLGERR